MATATKAAKAAAPKAAKAAAPKAAKAAAGPYRANQAWATAHATAKATYRGNPGATAALQVATHLAWRGPAASVAWHKGTNATMLAHAAALGVAPGQPVHKAMGLCVAALPAGPAATALAKATAAMAPA